MTQNLNRRHVLGACAWGSAVIGAGGAIQALTPGWAKAAAPRRRAPRISFVNAPRGNGIVFAAGGTAMDLYHAHPHNKAEEELQPEDIRLQTRLAMLNHKEILDWHGLTWRNVVKMTRYQKNMAESEAIEDVLMDYFKDWWPAMTAVEVTRLSSPQARVELELIAVPSNAIEAR